MSHDPALHWTVRVSPTGHQYIIMPAVDTDLRQYLDQKDGPCDPLFIVIFISQLVRMRSNSWRTRLNSSKLQIVAQVHASGVIHGDIKPENVGLKWDDAAKASHLQVYLLDFGGSSTIGTQGQVQVSNVCYSSLKGHTSNEGMY